MRRYLQQSRSQLVVFLVAFATYLFTMDLSASWWDCGEFIATGWGLQIGHPPGAPFYQLVTHCAMLLSFGNPMWVAPLSNLVSVLCGAFTVLLLYKTILLLLQRSNFHFSFFNFHFSAAIGAFCYLFCDTVWFSAVESEVYSMAMLFCALTVWLMLRWERDGDNRNLLLVALLLGLGVCVHLMTLLTAPALLWIFVRGVRRGLSQGKPWWLWTRTVVLGIVFFVLGLTPYAIIPLRAASNPPINTGDPSTYERFKEYLGRDQYVKAPFYPRMWREKDSENWGRWGTTDPTSVVDNVVYYAVYQFGFMYCRYMMFNFIGRWNYDWNIVVVSVLPFLLGIWGLWRHRRRRRGDFHLVLLLFLFGGIILNLYLNHPCYEPRERDYVYVLSFYAFAVWIGIGAAEICEKWQVKSGKWKWLMMLAPLLLAVGNWSDHDRHNCHSVHDISLNHLQSCDHGALLFTLGDNDTFPLWYLQHVEERRTDIDIYNLNLTGFRRSFDIISENDFQRPVYFSQYAYHRIKNLYPGRFRCEGFCWRLLPTTEGVDDLEPLQRHMADSIQWNIGSHEYVDRISKSFLKIWNENTKGCE
jgi:hypothetical protein